MTSVQAKASQRGFSLVELLVVIVVIGIIAGFAVPATQSVMRGSAMQSAIAQLSDHLSFARQYAVANSRTVEVRFYRFGDPEIPGEDAENPSSGHFRSFQSFTRSDVGPWVPISKIIQLPDQVIINPGARLSTIIGEEYPVRGVSSQQVRQDPNAPELPRGVGRKYDYVPVRFVSSGATDLAPVGRPGAASQGGRWHVTVHPLSELIKTNPPASDMAPPNYATWMVDPVSGIGRIYRPGLN